MRTPFRDRYRSARTAFLKFKDWVDPKTGTWKSAAIRKEHFGDVRKAVTEWADPRNSTQACILLYMLERPVEVNLHFFFDSPNRYKNDFGS